MAETDWFYFDKLPPALREALRTSAFDYNAKWFYNLWHGGFSVDRLISHIKESDLQYAAADWTYKVKGKRRVEMSPTAATRVMPLYR